MRLKSIWEKISENGISQELSYKEIIRIRLLNQIISIGFFTVFLLIIINLLSQQTIRFLLVAGFFMATALVSIYYRKYNIAILVFCFLYPIHFTYCVIRFDGNIGEANIFMVLGFVSLVMYEGKRTIQIISTLFISCLYVLSRLYVIHYDFIPQTHARTHDDLFPFRFRIDMIFKHRRFSKPPMFETQDIFYEK